MRTPGINKAMSYLAPSLITTGLFLSSTILATPLQGTVSATSKLAKETVLHTKTETGSLTKNPVLARNTTTKTNPVPTTAPVQKNQDKKALSRCWKRLMTMVHEVNHAHRMKSK